MIEIVFKDVLLSWAIIGFISLAIMTYSDIKKRMVDDRRNNLMFGFTLAISLILNDSILYILAIIVIIVVFNVLLRKFKKFIGVGDTNALSWIIFGMAIFNIYFLFVFLGVFFFINLIFYVIMKVMKIKHAPYFPVILSTFLLTNIIIYQF